ncbi:MAG: hypothetical protein V6Z82_05945 [Flavobacteriales bacterium]
MNNGNTIFKTPSFITDTFKPQAIALKQPPLRISHVVPCRLLEQQLFRIEEMGLMNIERTITDLVTIRLTANAFDLHRLGGFTGREELLKLNLQKLKLEVDALKSSFPKKAERITTILSNIASIVPMLMK